MKITTLVENLVYGRDLLAEHGLSFYIEIDNRSNEKEINFTTNRSFEKGNDNLLEKNKILFDCGQSSIFSKNALNLGIDLKEVDTLILSHGHYDHTGGLEKFLEINNNAKIYLKRESLLEKYNNGEYIGIPKGIINSNNKRVVFPNKQISQISKNLYLVSFPGEVISEKGINSAQKNSVAGFSVLQNGEFIKDSFNDEQYLVFINKNKISLITGCSHKGILKIITLVEELFDFPVCEIIGGLHTKKESEQEIISLARELNKSSVKNLQVCHCTGIEAFTTLKQNFNASISYNYTGNKFNSKI